MGAVYGLENYDSRDRKSVVAVGVFDGVHRGHQAIFRELLTVGASRDIHTIAFTFDRHPAELLAPNRAPYYISTLEQKVGRIAETGVDDVVVADFSPELAGLTAEDFLGEILIATLRASHIVVGSNFRFGRDRAGDTRTLSTLAPARGVGLTVVPAVVIMDGPASSTRIRALVSSGDVENAAKLLGRRFELRGEVVMGRQVGRTLGFPTANISCAPRQLMPAKGVYSVETRVNGSTYTGICNVGDRPTFGVGELSVEVHLSGFQGDLYGHVLDVSFVRRIRDEMKFESPEHLASQIRTDLERANDRPQ